MPIAAAHLCDETATKRSIISPYSEASPRDKPANIECIPRPINSKIGPNKPPHNSLFLRILKLRG